MTAGTFRDTEETRCGKWSLVHKLTLARLGCYYLTTCSKTKKVMKEKSKVRRPRDARMELITSCCPSLGLEPAVIDVEGQRLYLLAIRQRTPKRNY